MSDKDFEEWAFGPGPFYHTIDRMHAWNKLHGDKLTLNPEDLPSEALFKMKAIYKEWLHDCFRDGILSPHWKVNLVYRKDENECQATRGESDE